VSGVAACVCHLPCVGPCWHLSRARNSRREVVASFAVGALLGALSLVIHMRRLVRRHHQPPSATTRGTRGGARFGHLTRRGTSEEMPLVFAFSPSSSPPPVHARVPPRLPEGTVRRTSADEAPPRLPTPTTMSNFSIRAPATSSNSHGHSAHSVRGDDGEGGDGSGGQAAVAAAPYTRSGSAFKEVGLKTDASLMSETSTVRNGVMKLREEKGNGKEQ
jgi:hypothetical protein